MRLTIIPSDRTVIVDGVSATVTFTSPETVHALQWFNDTGWIEYTDGTANEKIEALPDWVGAAVDAHTVAVTPVPLTPEQIAAALIPRSVSPRQIRQALTRFNVRTQVEAAVAAGDQDIKDWWEFATVVERNHPMVVGMATALGISTTELDAIFVAAGAL